MELRYKHLAAMERAKDKWEEIDGMFASAFSRKYYGQVEEYMTDDADIVLVTSGSATGTARRVVERKRKDGVKIGLIKIRMFRPFPRERLIEVLKGRKAIGVLDRSVCFGWNCGPMYMELRAILSDIGTPPMLSFIDGLANIDITDDHIDRMIDDIAAASRSESYQEVTWVPLEEKEGNA
jgi:pyruvate/2-oxoacid:ferredoxin oxidoreductase alpha subunit